MTGANHSLDNSLVEHPVLNPDVLQGFHLLEADAGTGKTWTITRLVLRALLEKGLTIDQVVVVTFTKAAAAELKARIAALLDAWSGGVPDDDDPFSLAYQPPLPQAQLIQVVRQARLQLDDAPIHTIHGFCQRILSERAMSLGHWGEVEPGFDDAAALTEAVADWWRREIVHGDAERSVLIGKYGLDFDRLTQLLAKAISCPEATIAVQPDQDWSSLAQRMAQQVQRLSGLLVSEQTALLQWMTSKGTLNQRSYPADQLADRLAALESWLDRYPLSIDFDEPALTLFDPRRMTINKSGIDKRDQFGALEALSALNDLRVERSYLCMHIGAQIRDQVATAVERRKRDARQVTFDDLLHRTRRALLDESVGTALAQSLAIRFPIALIDEFQDTDPAQWTIFSQIYQPGESGEGHEALARAGCALVLVGDPKQAIYSFRNADVRTYLGARAQGAFVHRLGQNQRSSELLINGVNRLFQRPEPFAVPAIGFTPAVCGARAQTPDRQPPDDGLGALCMVLLSGLDPAGEPTTKAILHDRAASTCARQIQQLLSKKQDNASAVRAKDTAVLVRTLAQGRQIKKALAQVGIGAVEVSRDSVLLADEATDLLRVLAAVAAPGDDRLVRGALTTMLVGFNMAQLQSMEAEPAVWDQRFQVFETCQNQWVRQGPQACLRDLLFGFFDRGKALLAMPDGERRMTNVLHLIDLLGANEHAGESAAQAQAVLSRQRQLAIEAQGRDESTEVRLESDDELVRILTIHGSKGLEFPFVFLPYLWSGGGAGVRDTVLINDAPDDSPDRGRIISLKHGLELFKKPNWAIVPDGPDSPARLQEQFASQAAQEALRLAYVALTRASRRCYVYWGYREAIKGGKLEPTHQDSGSIGYLLDGQCQLSDKPLVTRVAARIDELVADQTGVASLKWHELTASAVLTGFSRAGSAPVAQRAGWPVPGSLTLASPIPECPPAWVATSFTGLMLSSHVDQATTLDRQELVGRPEHDEMLAEQLLMPSSSASLGIRQAFVRGANAGTCLHDILERLDYRKTVSVATVEQSLDRFGIEQASPIAAEVGSWLEEVLAAKLSVNDRAINSKPEAFQLNQIAPQDTRAELDFLLPIGGLKPSSLAQAVAREYPLAASLSERKIHGFMNGFIDLIVRKNNCYWVLDWKSNWLHEDARAYTQERMSQSIAEHGYALQFCLYTLVLHRWLRHSMPDYDYDQHVGGVHYVFLRGAGMPGASADNGLYSTRPTRALIEQLDHLLSGAPTGPAS